MMKRIATVVLWALGALFVLPAAAVIPLSFKDGLRSYADFFIWEPSYLRALLNSMFIAFASATGSVTVALLAAYAFSQLRFRGRGVLFYLYIIVMMMPFQVTLLPQYIVSRFLRVYDTPAAMILPGIFTPFAAFLLTQIMKTVPQDAIEAARLDTSSTLRVILRVIAPQMRGGIVCAGVLMFTEQWNAVAEPIVLTASSEVRPLAAVLSFAHSDSRYFAATTVFMLLPLGLYLMFESEIMEGLEGYSLR